MSELPTPPATGDSERLAALGYRQELRRSLGILGNIAMGFAVVSPWSASTRSPRSA